MPYRDITVLIVEDDITIGRLADVRLSSKHFKVLRAPDRLTAIELMGNADIMVLDLNLPNGDGKELLTLWSKRLDAGPAMVITGYPVKDEDISDAWMILRKPFDMDRLVDLVQRYAMVVRGMRCCREVATLKKRMTLMWIAIAALGGVELLVPAAKFIADLIPLGGFLP